MKEYLFNKAPKDPRLCKILRRAITLDRKRNGFEWEDIANELGLNGGTLENKLKPSYTQGDITISEFMHFMEISGDYSALEYIANKFDMIILPKKHSVSKITDLNVLADTASIKNSDVFKVYKVAAADNIIDENEAKAIIQEIDEAQKANAELRQRVSSILTQHEEKQHGLLG